MMRPPGSASSVDALIGVALSSACQPRRSRGSSPARRPGDSDHRPVKRGFADDERERHWRRAVASAGRRRVPRWYRPDQLVRGRVVIIGDAAHAASPMAGGGLRQGLYDAAALAAAFDSEGLTLVEALDHYEVKRLGPALAHVEYSEAASAHYLNRQGRYR